MYNVGVYDTEMENIFSIWNPEGQSIQPLSADMDNDFIWVGTKLKGLLKAYNNGWSGEFIKPNGPGSNNVFNLNAGGDNLWVAPGGRASNWSKLYMTDGVFSFVDGNTRCCVFSHCQSIFQTYSLSSSSLFIA